MRLLTDHFEDPMEPSHVLLSLRKMGVESFAQSRRYRRLRHLGESFHDLIFREKYVFQLVQK
jgi:hypothetical protein